MKLAVLFGGISSEHDISCLSAASILRNLNKDKYEIYPVGITRSGEWFYCPDCDPDRVESGAWERMTGKVKVVLAPDRGMHGMVLLREGEIEIVRLDCVFPVLHGVGGEDGTMQGLLELAGIPYVGCGVAASANTMDKALTKKVVEGTGVRQARYYLALRYDFERNAEAVIAAAAETLGAFPVFVKPCSQGSSVGVAKANNLLELAEGLTDFGFDRNLYTFARDGFAPFREEYKAACVNLGRRVTFDLPEGGQGAGEAIDVDQEGRLVVRTDSGEVHVFTGEVSVHGIYGAV